MSLQVAYAEPFTVPYGTMVVEALYDTTVVVVITFAFSLVHVVAAEDQDAQEFEHAVAHAASLQVTLSVELVWGDGLIFVELFAIDVVRSTPVEDRGADAWEVFETDELRPTPLAKESPTSRERTMLPWPEQSSVVVLLQDQHVRLT